MKRNKILSMNCGNETKYIKYRTIFIFNLIIILCTYGILTKTHFSIDSYSVYFNTSSMHLTLGRITAFLLANALSFLNINPLDCQSFFTMIFIISISICATYLVVQICIYISKLTYIKLLSVDLAILITYINVYFLEWFLYPESVIFFASNQLTLMLSIYFILKNQNMKNVFWSLIFLIISLNLYQINIAFYVIFCMTFILIKNNLQLNTNAIKESVIFLIIGFIAGALNILSLSILQHFNIIKSTSRNVNLDIQILLDNFKLLFTKGQYGIWVRGSGFMPKYLMLFFIIIFFLFLFYAIAKNKMEVKTKIYIFIVVVINYSIIYFPHLLTSTVWLAPRTIAGIFAFITSIILITIKLSEGIKGARYQTYITIVMALFLMINFIQIQDIITNQFATNKIDKEYIEFINRKIEKYEIENNIKIVNISTRLDLFPTYGYYDNIKYISYDTNLRALAVEWADVDAINYYTKKNFCKIEMSDEIYQKYFNNKDWNDFEPDEQMIFIDDTLYMMVY